MKSFRSLLFAFGVVAGVTLGSSTVHAKPLCIRLSSGEHLVFPTFKATKGQVRSVIGYHRSAGLAAGFYGTTIASSHGSNVGIGLTVPASRSRRAAWLSAPARPPGTSPRPRRTTRASARETC